MGPPEEENGRPRDAHPGKRPHGERPATGRLSDERAGRHRPYRAEPRGPLADRDRDLTAYHEAGHVLGYVLTGHAHRIEAVTVEPTAEARGKVRMTPAPIPVWNIAFVAALGPIAQAIRHQATDDDADDYELCDYITAALWTGGDEDAKAAAGIFDADPAVARPLRRRGPVALACHREAGPAAGRARNRHRHRSARRRVHPGRGVVSRRQDPAVRADRAAWAAAVAHQPLGVAARLVAGRATGDGRVRVAAADLATSCCLSVTAVADALADLAGRGLLARDGGALVLTLPAGRCSP